MSDPTITTSAPTAPTVTKKKPAKRKPAKKAPKNETEGHNLASFMDSDYGRKIGFKAASVYWRENGASTKNRGFRANLYRELAKRNLSADQTLEFAKKNGGSENDIKQISHFQTISALIAEVRGETKKAKRPAASKVKRDALSDKKAVAAS